jgi:hypothetical protein
VEKYQQNNHGSQIQDFRKKFDNYSLEKDDEISHFKNHSQNLLIQTNKPKDKKWYNQKFERGSQDIKNKFNKNFLEKKDENACLSNINKRLFKQIKCLKMRSRRIKDLKNKLDKPKNKEGLFHLRHHSQRLLAQIKKLKDENETQ